MLPWTCMGYSMEFHGTLEWPIKNHRVPWDSMEKEGAIQMTQLFHGIQWNIRWKSMELWYREMKYNLVPWNSMEYFMEFHGTLVPPNEISLSSMEFHGNLRLLFHTIPCYPVLAWDIPWNSMELWSCQIKNHPVLWDSMELGGRHFKWHKYSMEFHGILHGIPWNSSTTKWNIT